jgi:hypothetical protein
MVRGLVFALIVLINFVYAQNTSQQIWLDYNPQWNLNESYTFYGSVGARTIIPYSWDKLFFTTAVRYAPDPLFNILNKSQQELRGGLSFYYTFNEDSDNQIELRPFQAYKIRWPHFERVKFTHRLRIDERFIFTMGESDFEFELRARYKIEAIFHRTKHLVDFANGFYFPVSVEFLINLYSTTQFNDAIKITPGLGYSSKAKLWKIQFDLSFQYADKAEPGNFTKSTIIYRLRFYQAF